MALAHGEKPDAVLHAREGLIRGKIAEATQLSHAYTASGLTPGQRTLAGRMSDQLAVLQHDVIEPAFELTRRGDTARLDSLFQKTAPPVFLAIIDIDRQLVDLQIAQGRESYTRSVTELGWRLIAGVVAAFAGLLAVLALGWTLLRVVRRSVGEFEAHFDAIGHGNFQSEIRAPAAREFRRHGRDAARDARASVVRRMGARRVRAQGRRYTPRHREPYGADHRARSRRGGGAGGQAHRHDGA